MSAGSGEDNASRPNTEVDETTSLLSDSQRNYNDRARPQDEESSLLPAAIAAEEEDNKDNETIPQVVSPTAVVLVLIVGMFFQRVQCQLREGDVS